MGRQQTGFDALKRIVVLSLQITQLLLFGVGTALVWLSNIRGKRMTAFKPLSPSPAKLLEPPSPVTVLPRLPTVRVRAATPAETETSEFIPVYVDYKDDVTEQPVIATRSRGTDKADGVQKLAVEPKVILDNAFPGAMKSLGFTKAEVQCIVHEITAQDLQGQIRQALKLLNKPTCRK